ncbi:MAG: glycosyltransferase family 2 protein, partial [Planctomycetes bacterium]|nr:glycosyltransferase family 2 protein [Planctomycetota bacterium]
MAQVSERKLNLIIVMPALNEEATVGQMIRRVPSQMPGVGNVRVLVVDDGSTDNTVREATAAGAEVVSHGGRQGVGAAFQTGLARTIEMGADIIVTIDADGQFDPQTIPALIAP